MGRKLIEFSEGKVYGILARKSYGQSTLVSKLVEELKDEHEIMIWQYDDVYYNCKRVPLGFTTELEYLLDEMIEEFDVLIINRFTDWSNTREEQAFLSKIKNDDRLKNKMVIILFKAKAEGDILKVSDFTNIGDSIIKYCDEIIEYYNDSHTFVFIAQYTILSNEKRYYQQVFPESGNGISYLEECEGKE